MLLVTFGIFLLPWHERVIANSTTCASLMQRHFKASDATKDDASVAKVVDGDLISEEFHVSNMSFENELKRLYLQQVSLERAMSHQEPDSPDTTQGDVLSNFPDNLSAAGEMTVDAISNVPNWTVATERGIQAYVANHSLDKMMVYWFGPRAAWSCQVSEFSDQPFCGYFGGWVGSYLICIVLIVPLLVNVLYLFFILDLVMIDVDDPEFDDEAFKREHGYSLVRHQWEMKWSATVIGLPLEMIVLWQLGLLQVLLQALEPYAIGLLIIVSGLAPVAVTVYLKVRNCMKSAYDRLKAMESILTSLQTFLIGQAEAMEQQFQKEEGAIGKAMGLSPSQHQGKDDKSARPAPSGRCWICHRLEVKRGAAAPNAHLR